MCKLEGEEAIRASDCRHLILRAAWVYSGRGKNFLLTIRRLAKEKPEVRVVDDQVEGPPLPAQPVLASIPGPVEVRAQTFPVGLVLPDLAGQRDELLAWEELGQGLITQPALQALDVAAGVSHLSYRSSGERSRVKCRSSDRAR